MAFDIAGAMRYAQPVTSMQQGQAMRFAAQGAEQDLRLGAQAEELNTLKIAALKNPRPDPAEQRAADKARRERALEMISFGRDSAVKSLSIYQQAKEEGRTEREARDAAQGIMARDMQFATELWGEELAKSIDPDGVWTLAESRAAVAEGEDVLGKNRDLGDAVVFRDENQQPVGVARKGTQQYDALIAKGLFPGVPMGRPGEENNEERAPVGFRWKEDGGLEFVPGGPADPSGPGARKASMQLRKEYEDQDAVRGYRSVLPLYQRAVSAPDNRAGDVSVIYALGKMFDPTSVVREGELQLAQDAAPWLQKMAAGINSQITGEGRLTPSMRAEIMKALAGQIDALRAPYEQERGRYAGYAEDSGLTSDSVVGPDPREAFNPSGGDEEPDDDPLGIRD